MRTLTRRLAILLSTALVAAVTVVGAAPPPAGAQPIGSQPFSGYSTGTAVSVNALGVGTTQIAGVHAAFSGASVNSQGLNGTINDEFGQTVQPPRAGKDAYGRGTGLETGIATPNPQPVDVNQILLSGLAQADAPPPTGVPTPITRQIALNVGTLLSASVLTGQAQAIFDPNTCTIGQPLSFGRGFASNLQVLGVPATLGTNLGGNNASESRSFTYLIPNGDGTFGLVSETHQVIAPISLLGGAITIQAAGEFVLRATATGKPGDPRNGITYPGNPLITIKLGPATLLSLTLTQLLGTGGLNIPLGALANIRLGTPPRAIGGTGPASVAANGTSASAAVDAVGRVSLLTLPPLNALDLGLGHMESRVQVPAGGLRCEIPVSKNASPNPASAGQTVTWKISVPADAEKFAQLFACDLIGIKVTDTHSVVSGNPRFQITGADRGGVVSGTSVTWNNLGNYRRGDPPIILTVTGRIIGGTGQLRDIANVSATLGNCTGGIVGQDIVGQATFNGSSLNGSVTLVGPDIGRGHLAATGADLPYLLLGGLLLLAALETRRRVRNARAPATVDRTTQ